MKSFLEHAITKRSGSTSSLLKLLHESFERAKQLTLYSRLQARAPVSLPPALKHGQAGILYADIADYSRLTERDEEGTHIRLVECMKIMKTHITANGGRSAHFAGDAVLAEFSDASSALICAIDAQLALYQWNRRLPPGQKLLFRVGVNFGKVISDQGDIYGNAVNLATRLEGLAKPGGICVSDSVRLNVGAKLVARLVSIGKRHVKNISKPVHAFSIEMDPDPCSSNHFQSTRPSPAFLTMLPT